MATDTQILYVQKNFVCSSIYYRTFICMFTAQVCIHRYVCNAFLHKSWQVQASLGKSRQMGGNQTQSWVSGYCSLCQASLGKFRQAWIHLMYWYKCVFLEFTRLLNMHQCLPVMAASLCWHLLYASQMPSAMWHVTHFGKVFEAKFHCFNESCIGGDANLTFQSATHSHSVVCFVPSSESTATPSRHFVL